MQEFPLCVSLMWLLWQFIPSSFSCLFLFSLCLWPSADGRITSSRCKWGRDGLWWWWFPRPTKFNYTVTYVKANEYFCLKETVRSEIQNSTCCTIYSSRFVFLIHFIGLCKEWPLNAIMSRRDFTGTDTLKLSFTEPIASVWPANSPGICYSSSPT